MKRLWFALWLLAIAIPVQAGRTGPSYRVFKSKSSTIIAQEPVLVKVRNGKTSITSRGTIRVLPAPLPRGMRLVKPRR